MHRSRRPAQGSHDRFYRNWTLATDGDGFGGHPPLFHTTVTPAWRNEVLARLLLRSGADPNLPGHVPQTACRHGDRAQQEMREYGDATAID